MPQTKWGDWSYDATDMTLKNQAAPGDYWIDLREATTSAQVLDWIIQISEKTWATNDTVGDLVSAFNDLLKPQATLCSSGNDRGPITDVRQLLQDRGY